MSNLTQARLKKVLYCDPETGLFTWIARASNKGPNHVGNMAGGENNWGYIKIKIYGVFYLAHILAWLYMKGEWPKHEIDHKDTDPSNNKWKNLRPATRSINCQNLRKAHRDSKTGLLGVSWNKKGPFSQIRFGGKNHYLGNYQTEELAHEAYLKAKREQHEGCTI
jgi:AP2 domain.